MLIWYRNSFLASLISIAGCASGMLAVSFLLSGNVSEGILCAVIAAGLLYGGKKLSQKKAFEKWWSQVKKANLEPEIRRSKETAVEIYKKNPEKWTLEKIRRLNPEAAAYIENGFRVKVPNAYEMPSSTTPAPQTAPVQSQNRDDGKLFCTNCGQQLSSGSKFCSSCGSMVSGQPSGYTTHSAPAVKKKRSNTENGKKKENRKLIVLAIAFVVLLVILRNVIYQDVKAENPETKQTIPVQTETVAKVKVPVNRKVNEKFEYEGGYTFASTFAEPLMGCREFTLEYEIYPLEGDEPADSVLCDVYAKTTTGGWEMVAAFQMEGTMESHRIYLKEPMDIAALAVVYNSRADAYDIRVYDPV